MGAPSATACLYCGCSTVAHSYADGRCRCGRCAAFVDRWPEEEKPATRIPLADLKAPDEKS